MSVIRNKENQVWYLLLHFGVPCSYSSDIIKDHLRIAQKSCKKVSVTVNTLQTAFRKSKHQPMRYIFRFPRYERDDQRAIHVAEAFIFGFAVTGGPFIERDHDGYVLPIPRQLLEHGDVIDLEDLIELEETRPWDERTIDHPHSTICTSSSTSKEPYEVAWRLLPLLLQREDLFDAVRFLKASKEEFYVYPGQIREVLSKADSTSTTKREQNILEAALHNAFKAIEAVIGDPPRNDEKLFARLRAIRLDPHEIVGHENKEELFKVIRKMNLARDKKSAHGSTRNRTLTLGEVFDYQCCSKYVVYCALESALGHPLL